MSGFWLLFLLLIGQRLVELVIAKRNERWMKARGASEVGAEHYKWIVAMHILFFMSLVTEVVFLGARPAEWWPIPFAFFLAAQGMRFWALLSLGRFWNTKIIVLPDAKVVEKGPYRFIRHPNYVTVAVEILTVPLIFQAYVTAALFSILNAAVLLGIRIPTEEEALRKLTNYEESTGSRSWIFNKDG